jgi:hypothetical protein
MIAALNCEEEWKLQCCTGHRRVICDFPKSRALVNFLTITCDSEIGQPWVLKILKKS